MSLSSEEIERYARHIVLHGVGGPGQQKLKAARVLVVGAGLLLLEPDFGSGVVLLATAIGLFAAIPAVKAGNRVSLITAFVLSP